MDPAYNQYLESGPRPHPYLHEPLLYISNVPAYISDEMLAMAFVSCGPFRPKIQRVGSSNTFSGIIEFKFLEKAEKALTILQSRHIPELSTPVPLALSPYPPTDPPTSLPPPSALPRLVKQLPLEFTDSQLYDLFRPFGALASAYTQTQFGPDAGIVEFWNEEDAIQAEQAMHCSEVEGQNIAVQVYQPRPTTSNVEFNVAAPTFVPSGLAYPSYPSPYSPSRSIPYSPLRSPVQTPPSPFIHGPGQQVQLAPVVGPGSSSHSGLIDPCNLFCKNLSPEIDSNKLFTHFSRFGQIVSARVMRDENGGSRGFGFVSYHEPEHAAEALRSMNGATLGSKQIVVRLHEPKQLRQEKLAQRFGHNGHPRRSSSGATSPAISETGEQLFGGWNSPRLYPSTLGSPALSPTPIHFERTERGRRGSGSYYTAALNGTLNMPITYNSLSTLSTVVRKEVLTGEVSRQVKSLESVDDKDVDTIVESIVSLSLSNVLQILEDPTKLKEQVEHFVSKLPRTETPEGPPSRSASQATSQDSRLLDNSAAASAPEHPSTPISLSPARTSSPAGSMPPVSERDRLFAAIAKFETSRQADLTELIMSLPRRERALCIFNTDVLRAKLADAKMVLDSESADYEDGKSSDARSTKSAPVPSTPQAKSAVPQLEASPHTPDLSSAGVSTATSSATSPAPVTLSLAPEPSYTIASLAKLPAAEIVRLANSASASKIPLPKADPLIVQATNEFIDQLICKPPAIQKQSLGEKLFKVIKSLGITKGAPKVTITLLDQEDLRALAHLMDSYPSVLKEKALAVVVKS